MKSATLAQTSPVSLPFERLKFIHLHNYYYANNINLGAPTQQCKMFSRLLVNSSLRKILSSCLLGIFTNSEIQ